MRGMALGLLMEDDDEDGDEDAAFFKELTQDSTLTRW